MHTRLLIQVHMTQAASLPWLSFPTCACSNDCKEEVHSTVSASSGEVRVFCFEPNQANFAQLVLTRDHFFKNNKPELQW
jgi:hypothetical protein